MSNAYEKWERLSGPRSSRLEWRWPARARVRSTGTPGRLGMLSIARGATQLWTGGFPITGLGPQFGSIGTGHFLGVPMPVWISGALVAVFVLITKKTRFGRHLYAVGGDERAAQLTGLNLNRIKVAVYALGGLLAGVGGLLLTARLDSATPNTSATSSTPSRQSSSAARRSPADAAPSSAPCSAASSSAC